MNYERRMNIIESCTVFKDQSSGLDRETAGRRQPAAEEQKNHIAYLLTARVRQVNEYNEAVMGLKEHTLTLIAERRGLKLKTKTPGL